MRMTKTAMTSSMPPVYKQPESLIIPLEIRLDKRLCPEVIACIDDGLSVYSKAYRSAFSRIDHGQRNLNQLTKELQDQYGLKSRAANSIARDAKARHQARLELARAQAKNLQASILGKKKRLKKLKKKVEEKKEKPRPEGWITTSFLVTTGRSRRFGVWASGSSDWKRNGNDGKRISTAGMYAFVLAQKSSSKRSTTWKKIIFPATRNGKSCLQETGIG